MTIIFLLSSRQRVEVSPDQLVNFVFFKTLHVMEYAMLFLLYVRALKNFVAAFLLTILYAISDEVHQTFVPTREGKVRDVIIDAIGASLAWYSLKQLLPKAPKKLLRWAKHWQLIYRVKRWSEAEPRQAGRASVPLIYFVYTVSWVAARRHLHKDLPRGLGSPLACSPPHLSLCDVIP
jgi:hypothetical protein